MRLTHRLAAQAIRRHFWQPIQPGPLDGRPWTMARELQIFDRLARDFDPLELIGAIEKARGVLGTDSPMRMTWFIRIDRGRALLTRSVAAFHSQAPPGPPRGGSLERFTFELPPPNPQHEDTE